MSASRRPTASARGPGHGRGGAAATLPPQHEVDLADGITAVLQEGGGMGVSNASFVVEDGRAFVVDSMLLPEMAAGIAAAVGRRGARAEVVLTTHHHLDHLGGTAALPAARPLGHPVSVDIARRMTADMAAFDRLMPRFLGRFTGLPLRLPAALDPDDLRLPRGGELLVFGPAHTPADLAVWFPGPGVLLAGDLCFNRVTPLAIHGHLAGWVAALGQLLRLAPHVIVPGHGPLAEPRDVVLLRGYLELVLEAGRSAAVDGASLEDAVRAFDPGAVGDWLEPERTRLNLARAMADATGATQPGQHGRSTTSG